jgi:hypothetical protein
MHLFMHTRITGSLGCLERDVYQQLLAGQQHMHGLLPITSLLCWLGKPGQHRAYAREAGFSQ